MEGSWFVLCSKTAFRLILEESMNSRHSMWVVCFSHFLHQGVDILAEHKGIFVFEERLELIVRLEQS
jgi:hypothetical protein